MFEGLFSPLHLLILIMIPGLPLLVTFLIVRRMDRKARQEQIEKAAQYSKRGGSDDHP